MNRLRLTCIATLLSTSSVYVGAAPDWTAAIGTGHASDTRATIALPTATGVPSSPHWSALIGAGHAADTIRQRSTDSSKSEPPTADAHWTAQIGTGHAADSNAGVGRPAHAASRSGS
jgi:hypothetical protein